MPTLLALGLGLGGLLLTGCGKKDVAAIPTALPTLVQKLPPLPKDPDPKKETKAPKTDAKKDPPLGTASTDLDDALPEQDGDGTTKVATGLTEAQREQLEETVRYELDPYITAATTRGLETVIYGSGQGLGEDQVARAVEALGKALAGARIRILRAAEQAAEAELGAQIGALEATSPDAAAISKAKSEIRSAASQAAEALATEVAGEAFQRWLVAEVQ